MKFYYNGKLVRTSKSHIYTHAVIDMKNNHLEGCRAKKEAAEHIITSEISRKRQEIKNCEAHKKAIEQGKKMWRAKDGNRTYWMPVEKEDTVEKVDKHIAYYEEAIKYIEENWKVVELEAR